MTKDKFSDFAVEVSALLLCEGSTYITVVFDNAPSHRDLPRLLSDNHEYPEFFFDHVLAYSPDCRLMSERDTTA